MEAIRRCDAVFVCVSRTPNEGVMVELGVAIALGKLTFLFCDDMRASHGEASYPLDARLFLGMPDADWQSYYYSSLEQIADSSKAFARWVGGQTLVPPDTDAPAE